MTGALEVATKRRRSRPQRVVGVLLVLLAIAAAVPLFALAFVTSGGFDNESVFTSDQRPVDVDVRPDTDYFLYVGSDRSLATTGCRLKDAATGRRLRVTETDGPHRKLQSIRRVARGEFHTGSDRVRVRCEESVALGPSYDVAHSRLLDGAVLLVPLSLAGLGLYLLGFGRSSRGATGALARPTTPT